MWKCKRKFLSFIAIALAICNGNLRALLLKVYTLDWKQRVNWKWHDSELKVTTPSDTFSNKSKTMNDKLPPKAIGSQICQRLWGTYVIQIANGRLMANLRTSKMSRHQMKENTLSPEPPHKLKIGTSWKVHEKQGTFTPKHFICRPKFHLEENGFIFQPQN